MRKYKRAFQLLLPGILCLIGLSALLYFVSPDQQYGIAAFFLLFFLGVTLTVGFLLKNVRRGILMALFMVSFLLLQYFQLRNLFFVILLAAAFFALDLAFTKRK